MLKDITLGQFFPGDTLAHKLDPRTKLLVTVFYVVALFTAKSYIAYGVLILTLIVAVRISRVGAKALFKGLKPVLFIIAFTALLNLFYTPGTELCHFWIFRITIEGVRAAITMMLRITLLIMGTFLLTYTTSPIRLTDGLESLLGPLKKIKVPVHELAMMMSIALRFIPILLEETDKIMSAQKARGADFESGNVFKRAKSMLPILIPLFLKLTLSGSPLTARRATRWETKRIPRTAGPQIPSPRILRPNGMSISATEISLREQRIGLPPAVRRCPMGGVS